ncbi:hypothetical protein PF004_g1910 [Phytophthora fragariae]|uniref:Uncharacterized protein n=1 Tax=Phytophthora fragariae TaxID=53985 RepID=A0A6G0PRH1_9STRA|nr:hypothetical protein PF004_g1910 [Phytophthora fragariae]
MATPPSAGRNARLATLAYTQWCLPFVQPSANSRYLAPLTYSAGLAPFAGSAS